MTKSDCRIKGFFLNLEHSNFKAVFLFEHLKQFKFKHNLKKTDFARDRHTIYDTLCLSIYKNLEVYLN